MGQIAATAERTIKELIREKSVLFWTIAWPILWVIIAASTFISNMPEDQLPYLRGAVTIPMMVFALMIAGMSNLPASVASDRERGMLTKLMSMPITPWRDYLGRIIGLAFFSIIAVSLVGLVGVSIGAKFDLGSLALVKAAGFLVLIFFASSGVGTLIASLIKPVHGAIMTGVGISVITAAIGGMFTSYEFLPDAIQAFARVYPISIGNSAIIFVLVGEEYAGYDPMNFSQIGLAVSVTAAIVFAGVLLYSRYCWIRR